MNKSLGDRIVARAKSAKYSLRKFLVKTFPVGYHILYTPGNWDETPWALIAGHREVVRLMKQPPLSILVEDHPTFVYRPYRWYLANSFTKKVRRTILKHHYAYLLTRVNQVFFSEISRSPLQLWQKNLGEDVLAIKLSFIGELHHEGDLHLEFQLNTVRLYHLSFSIAPGHLTGSKAAQVILIGHVLGIAGHFDDIRRVTKACLDIAPPYLLMAAVQGISDALNIGEIAGIKNVEQITSNSDDSHAQFSYDAFWRTHLGTEAEKFFLIPVPISEKPLAMIATSHRRRTRLKRQFKSDVAKRSNAALLSFLDGKSS